MYRKSAGRLSDASPAVNAIPIAVGPGLQRPGRHHDVVRRERLLSPGLPFTVTTLDVARAPGAKSITSGCEASPRANRAVIVPVIGDF